jgi:hypothetical protein
MINPVRLARLEALAARAEYSLFIGHQHEVQRELDPARVRCR